MTNFLNQFNQACDANFQLILADNSIVDCQRVVRVIPQKRVVCQAIWHNKAVYAKLFLGADAAKYAARDAAGVKFLSDANINTPALLAQTTTQDNSAKVLIFEAITPAQTAEQVWPDLDAKQRLILASNLVVEVAKHHNAGLIQTDLYLKNFLVTDKLIYTLDGDGIRQFADLSNEIATQNLCVLLSKFDVLETQKWVETLLETYFRTRGRVVEKDAVKKDNKKNNDLADIILKANQHRLKVASAYADKKVFRQCTDVNIDALEGLFYAASSHANLMLPKNISALDALMQPQNLLKNGNTCTVALTDINGKKIVIKRYNIKSFWHGVGRAFRQTRAAVSWANAHRLNVLGIATAQPIALIETRQFRYLRGKAYFLAQYIDAFDVAEYFAQTQDKIARAEAVKNIVTLFYKLYLLQISHGDMKATNIKMQGTKPVLIDLDSLQQHRKIKINTHIKDLQRFMQNWQNEPALYNAFVKTFKVVYPDISILVKAGIGQNKDMFKEINN